MFYTFNYEKHVFLKIIIIIFLYGKDEPFKKQMYVDIIYGIIHVFYYGPEVDHAVSLPQ